MGYVLVLLVLTSFVYSTERVGKTVDEYTVIYSPKDLEKVFAGLTAQIAAKELSAVTDFISNAADKPLELYDIYSLFSKAQVDYQVFIYKTFKEQKDLFAQMAMRAVDLQKIEEELYERLVLPSHVRVCSLHLSKKNNFKQNNHFN